LEPVQLYERVQQNIGEELNSLRRRNEAIRRSLEVEKAGLSVNYTLYDEEAELFRHMRLSKGERYGRLRSELWNLSQKHLDEPPRLADDYVLGRVHKHCCFLFDLESLLGNKEIENEYYKFKEMFDTRARKEEVRNSFKGLVQQIHTLKGEILASEKKKDALEAQGFSYDEGTFDDLFVKKFKDVVNISTDSSDDDDKDLGDDGPGDNQIDSSSNQIGSSSLLKPDNAQNSSGKDSFFDLDSKNNSSN